MSLIITPNCLLLDKDGLNELKKLLPTQYLSLLKYKTDIFNINYINTITLNAFTILIMNTLEFNKINYIHIKEGLNEFITFNYLLIINKEIEYTYDSLQLHEFINKSDIQKQEYYLRVFNPEQIKLRSKLKILNALINQKE